MLLPHLFDLLLVLLCQFLLFLSMAGLNLFDFTPVINRYFALNGFLSLVIVSSCIEQLSFGPLEVVLRLGKIGLEGLHFLGLFLSSLI